MSSDMILFDLDGTLWDASNEILEAWNICFADHGVPTITLRQLTDNLGKPLAEMLRNMFPELSPEARAELLPVCSDFELEYLKKKPGKPFPGVEQTLSALKETYGFRFGIVSNCQENYIELFLDSCGFPDLFVDRECSGHTRLSKGQNILLVSRRNGCDRCLYVGDAQTDADAAAEAGIPFIHASYGFGTAKACDASIRSFPELLEAVPAILGM